MAETKHTPGPWRAECRDSFDTHREIGDDGVRFWDVGPGFSGPYRGEVCTVHSAVHIGGITIEERDANARLIAAAPEMLAMLKVAQLWLDVDGRFDIQGINAAIAKAEGRS